MQKERDPVRADTEGILRECDAGAKMGIDSIDEVIDRVQSEELRKALKNSRREHVALRNDIAEELDKNGFPGKDPSFMAELMSKGKIMGELLIDPTDSRIAELMIDGCDMGVKKLSQYINRFPQSDSPAVHLAERLVKTEQELADALRVFL